MQNNTINRIKKERRQKIFILSFLCFIICLAFLSKDYPFYYILGMLFMSILVALIIILGIYIDTKALKIYKNKGLSNDDTKRNI